MPARVTPRPDTLPDIDALLWELAQRYRREVLKAYERYDLAGADVLLIEALAKNINTPTALARTLGWVAPQAALVLRRLETRELIERQQNPRDARSVRVTLTPMGLELVKAVGERRKARLEAILTGFPTRERGRLQHYLTRLTGAISTVGGSTEDA